jgi:hypothetical protein
VTRCARLVEGRSAKSGAPGNYLAERGTGLRPHAPYPHPRVRPPSSASLRTRSLTIPNTSCKIRRSASLRSEACSDLSGNAVRTHPGTAFGFVGMPIAVTCAEITTFGTPKPCQKLNLTAQGLIGAIFPSCSPAARRRYLCGSCAISPLLSFSTAAEETGAQAGAPHQRWNGKADGESYRAERGGEAATRRPDLMGSVFAEIRNCARENFLFPLVS